MDALLTLDRDNISEEHICCAFSDKKCSEGYQAKKNWLEREFSNGYVFRRLNERAKVFMEYGPAEKAWLPIEAPGYLNINCFWVSGKYKGKGYGKELLRLALDDAESKGRHGLVSIAGTGKFHFMSDGKWLLRQGFSVVESTAEGFSLYCLKLKPDAPEPGFGESVYNTEITKKGLLVYYSNRCPFTEFHVHSSLPESAKKRNLNLEIIKLESMEEARKCPSPASIFSLYLDGKFITTDIGVCMDSRFDKVVNKALST